MTLDVRDLTVRYGDVTAVERVSFRVERGETLGIVGGSGSGKSSMLLALMGLVDAAGSVRLDGEELLGAPETRWESRRGKDIAIVFQDALSALNPVYTVGTQLQEAIDVHGGSARVDDLLALVGLEPGQGRRYPHELSGGMRQRVLVAMAMANDPAVLLLDEPTTALDVTVQAQVLDVLDRVRARTDTATVLVTHDLGVVARMADRVLVMERGRVVDVDPFTGLDTTRRAAPRLGAVVLAATGLVKHFHRRRNETVHAVCGVDLDVRAGETVAVVGESGSGKTTLGRCLVGLIRPDAGDVRSEGRRPQLVFQDPLGSLNPRLRVDTALVDAMRSAGVHRRREHDRVAELLALVHLDPAHARRYPHELSGGERQRVGIARALAVGPEAVVLDEPVSSLDVAVQRAVLDLLAELQEDLGVAYVFVSHDLGVVRRIAHRVTVLYLGTVVETGAVEDVYHRPRHPYTKALLSAVPVPDPAVERRRTRIVVAGEVPSPTDPPPGCRFHPRCWLRRELAATGTDTTVCTTVAPPLDGAAEGHRAACHFA